MRVMRVEPGSGECGQRGVRAARGSRQKSLGAAPCAAGEGLPGLRYGTAEPGEVEE
jgi:hypothetical protein